MKLLTLSALALSTALALALVAAMDDVGVSCE